MTLLVRIGCLVVVCLAAWQADAPASANSDQAELVKGNNTFAVELYGQFRNQTGNLFFSPESISTALAMTYAGARGDTATEMSNVLHFTLPAEKLHPAMGALLRELNSAHDGYQLNMANALWTQLGYSFLPDFLSLTKNNYGATLNQVDFKDAAEAARQTINGWVEQQTNNKVKDLVAPGVLDAKTRLVLINAIYFKGDWDKPFKREYTRAWDFHVTATLNVNARQMQSTDEFGYLDGGTFQALEIPYKNRTLSMIIFLPRNTDGLITFEQMLTTDKMDQWLHELRLVPKAFVVIPKFATETRLSLANQLMAIGMTKAFSDRDADFGGITSKKAILREGNLYINAIVHKAHIDVNEEGTEAAVATAASANEAMPTLAVEPPPISFRADHPFLFVIRDNESGAILFMGRVTDPTK